MAFAHGKSTAFSIEDPTVERNLSAFTDNVSPNVARALSEVTAFGDGGVKNIPGLQNGTVSISGHWDPTTSTGPHAVMSALLTATATAGVKIGPAGSASGAARVSAEVWITSYQITSAVADKVSWSADLQIDGTATFDTYP